MHLAVRELFKQRKNNEESEELSRRNIDRKKQPKFFEFELRSGTCTSKFDSDGRRRCRIGEIIPFTTSAGCTFASFPAIESAGHLESLVQSNTISHICATIDFDTKEARSLLEVLSRAEVTAISLVEANADASPTLLPLDAINGLFSCAKSITLTGIRFQDYSEFYTAVKNSTVLSEVDLGMCTVKDAEAEFASFAEQVFAESWHSLPFGLVMVDDQWQARIARGATRRCVRSLILAKEVTGRVKGDRVAYLDE